jgi:hypothetical protein
MALKKRAEGGILTMLFISARGGSLWFKTTAAAGFLFSYLIDTRSPLSSLNKDTLEIPFRGLFEETHHNEHQKSPRNPLPGIARRVEPARQRLLTCGSRNSYSSRRSVSLPSPSGFSRRPVAVNDRIVPIHSYGIAEDFHPLPLKCARESINQER